MAETRREKAALQTLHADNTAGDISAQDNRDGWETCHPSMVIQSGAYASLPGSGQVTGDLYRATDSPYLFRWNGSAWIPNGPIFPMTLPVSGDFAWINQGSATVVTTNGPTVLQCASNGGAFSPKVRKKAAPSTPYTITAQLLLTGAYGGIGYGGLCFRQSSDGKMAQFGIGVDSAGSRYTSSRKMTDATTYSADYTLPEQDGRLQSGVLAHMRIADNGTNRILSYSVDGVSWITFHSIGRTDFLTANEVGFFVDPYSTQMSLTLLSWVEG